MGLLAPLYLAGLAALSLPIVLHLVRRTPRGRQIFSSLMFLRQTPPRLSRRSRIDHWLLLALRVLALGAVAFAFARPFLREASTLTLGQLPGRRVALVIDRSASLRRGDLWSQSLDLARQELDRLGPQDDIALYAFGDHVERLVDFEQPDRPPSAAKPEIIRAALARLNPTWESTDLAGALVAAATDLDTSTDAQPTSAQPQITLISDFQRGSRMEALERYEWPSRVHVLPRQVALSDGTNARAEPLTSQEGAPDAEVRVRVANASDSRGDQFSVSWRGATGAARRETPVYVPPGQSRVIKLPRDPADQLDRLVLAGDQGEFDNSYYVVPHRKETVTVLYAGEDEFDDAGGIPFYLRLAAAGDPLRQVEVVPLATADGAARSTARLIVVSRLVSVDERAELDGRVRAGATLVLVPASPAAAALITDFLDDVRLSAAPPEEAVEDHYLLLGEIDFSHPLFAPFANPRYSDFTRIHFWRGYPLALAKLSKTRALARFDNGDPAVLERPVERGHILALATTWRPSDSQLAMSSKFVSLIGGMLNLAVGSSVALPDVTVNEPARLPREFTEAATIMTTPSGRQVPLPAGADIFRETVEPGVYQAQAGARDAQFAVNVAAAESDTAPLDVQRLEQLGIRLGTEQSPAERLDWIRQQRDAELEGRQKIWRWMIVLTLGLLMIETWLSGRTGNPTENVLEATP